MPDPAQIEHFYRNSYADMIRLQAMQGRSKLQPACINETLRGQQTYFDQYGQATWKKRLVRNEENEWREVPRARRQISTEHFEHTEMVDFRDDPQRTMRNVRVDSQYIRAVMSGLFKERDTAIVNAFDGTAYVYDPATNGNTTAPFDTTNQEIDESFGTASSGLITEKLIEAQQILRAADVQEDVPWYCAVHPATLATLLNDSKAQDSDFNTIKALVRGEINTWLGFNFIWTTAIPEYDTGKRYAYCFTGDCMVFGMHKDVKVCFDEIPLHGHGTQIAVYSDFAATRLFEDKIVRIECVS